VQQAGAVIATPQLNPYFRGGSAIPLQAAFFIERFFMFE
jgi:hypothetical protein